MADARWDFRRLRHALRRNGSSPTAKDDGDLDPQHLEDPTAPREAIAADGTLNARRDHPASTITHSQMQRTVDDQKTSILFSRLPLEIRRLIYLEVWRDYVQAPQQPGDDGGPELRLHIYTDGLKHRVLRHSRCLIHRGSPVEEDGRVIEPYPFDDTSIHTPPMWYWHAWVLRMHWGKHWKCQSAIMKRWDPPTGTAAPPETSPFLSVFLTCKKMYWEGIASLFNHTTLVFTSSEDAYRFFIRDRHPFADGIRSLELNFTNPNDHLFLTQVQRERPTGNAADESNEADAGAGSVMSSRIAVFGPALWAELVEGLRAAAPGLRDLDIAIGGRLPRDIVLATFGGSAVDRDVQDGLADESGWAIAGKVEVIFKYDGLRYWQDGRKMVVQP